MSNQPTQCDPNWLERVNIQANLPIEDPMFLPVINVSVHRSCVFGLSESTLSYVDRLDPVLQPVYGVEAANSMRAARDLN